MSYLAIRRKAGETAVFSYPGGRIEVTVAAVDGMTGQATLAILAPGSVSITRKELEGRTSAGDRNK